MAIESHDKVIGATRYRVTQLGAKKGREMLVRLVKLAGPGLAAGLAGLSKADGKDTEAPMARALSDALYDLATRLTVEEFNGITDELAKHTTIVLGDLEPRLSDKFDDHFSGKYDEMLRWAAFALEVNFKSFFVGSGGGGGLMTRLSALMTAPPSPSPTTSTGTSTG